MFWYLETERRFCWITVYAFSVADLMQLQLNLSQGETAFFFLPVITIKSQSYLTWCRTLYTSHFTEWENSGWNANVFLWVGNPSWWRLRLTALLLCHLPVFDYRYRWVLFWADMWSHVSELPWRFSVSLQQRLHHVWTGPLRRWVYTGWRKLHITSWA